MKKIKKGGHRYIGIIILALALFFGVAQVKAQSESPAREVVARALAEWLSGGNDDREFGGLGGIKAQPFVLITDPAITGTPATTTQFFGGIIPSVNNSFDLGSPSSSWRDVYASGTIRGSIAFGSGTTTFTGGIIVDSSDFVVIPVTNRIGIGTANPQKRLELRAASLDTGSFLMTMAGVDHGMTDILPTDSYGYFQDNNGGSGGLLISGSSDAIDTQALTFNANFGVADPNDNVAAISFVGRKKNGTTAQAMGNAETVIQFANHITTILTLMGNGDLVVGSDNTQDLGTAALSWNDIYFDGNLYKGGNALTTTSTFTFVLGDNTTGTNKGALDFIRFPYNCTIGSVTLYATSSVPTNYYTVADINVFTTPGVATTSIFTDQGQRPSLGNQAFASSSVPGTTLITRGRYLNIDLDQAAGHNGLTAQIDCAKALE